LQRIRADFPLGRYPLKIEETDLACIPTTAACPAFAYTPAESATLVAELIALGAVPFGKTNLDQFATGLNGTRSPYSKCRNSVHPDYPSGGSSAGSLWRANLPDDERLGSTRCRSSPHRSECPL
jgi:allophanate hydrolase